LPGIADNFKQQFLEVLHCSEYAYLLVLSLVRTLQDRHWSCVRAGLEMSCSVFVEGTKIVHTQVDLLLYSLLQDETCQRILSKAAGKGAFSSLMQQMVRGYEEHLRTLPSVTGATGQQKVAAPSLTTALKDANSSKMRLKDDFISVEHMLMACVKAPRIRSSGVLQKYGISEDAIETAVEDVRKGRRGTRRQHTRPSTSTDGT
jgi:ATP-dependent Clp protease ATP-binding subunit ClpA